MWTRIREVVIRGDFTLGVEVDRLEEEFAGLCGAAHAMGAGARSRVLVEINIDQHGKSKFLSPKFSEILANPLRIDLRSSLQELSKSAGGGANRAPNISVSFLCQQTKYQAVSAAAESFIALTGHSVSGKINIGES